MFFDEIKQQESFRDKVRSALNHHLGMRVEVKLLERKTLEDALKKSGKIVDKREL